MIGSIALLIGFWAMATMMIFLVFAEDVVENERCGRSLRARLQLGAIIGVPPLLMSTAYLLSLLLI